MSGREEMLERVKKALGHPLGSPAPVPEGTPEPVGDILPATEQGDLIAKFEEELQKVAGCAYRAATLPDLEAIVRRILGASEGTGVVLSRNPLLSELGLKERLEGWGKTVAVWPASSGEPVTAEDALRFRELAFSAGVGITGVDLVLAESGTLILSSVTEGAQLASLAPPEHVALYRRRQVVGSLEEALERLPVPRDASLSSPGRAVVFITGPSRTADIEQILIRGVHGPRELHAILIEDSCL
jgi:L-lactate dehydrogenase complex protein LldG